MVPAHRVRYWLATPTSGPWFALSPILHSRRFVPTSNFICDPSLRHCSKSSTVYLRFEVWGNSQMCWGHRVRVQKQLKSSGYKSYSCPRALARIIKITGIQHTICLAVLSLGQSQWVFRTPGPMPSIKIGQLPLKAETLSKASFKLCPCQFELWSELNSACTSTLTHSSFLRTKKISEVMHKQPGILHTRNFLLEKV